MRTFLLASCGLALGAAVAAAPALACPPQTQTVAVDRGVSTTYAVPSTPINNTSASTTNTMPSAPAASTAATSGGGTYNSHGNVYVETYPGTTYTYPATTYYSYPTTYRSNVVYPSTYYYPSSYYTYPNGYYYSRPYYSSYGGYYPTVYRRPAAGFRIGLFR
jgi:hypothetical protein